MKRNTVKRIKQRSIATALALVLLGQTAPLTTFAEDLQADTQALPQESLSDATSLTEESVSFAQSQQAAESESAASDAQDLAPDSAKTAENPLEESVLGQEQEADGVQEQTIPSETDDLHNQQDSKTVPDKAEEGMVQINSEEQLLQGVPSGSTYVLTKDLSFSDQQQIGQVAGILDGAGHTITINGKPLVKELTGTIQNLMVDGKASLNDGQGSIVCTINGGTLQNCASTVAIDPGWSMQLGGLAGNVINGKIYNSFFAGSGRDEFGLVAINGIFCMAEDENAPSQIKNCYYTEGNGTGSGSAWNRSDPSNGKKSAKDMKTSEFSALLNASNVGSGYIWAAAEGELPHLIAGGGELQTSDKKALKAAMDEAQQKHQQDYTAESWQQMQNALETATTVWEKIDVSQSEVDQAEKELRNALAALQEKKRELSPVEPPKNGIILISSQEELARVDGSNAAAFYQLSQDIVIEGNFVPANLSGVFDGNGHTVTIRTGSPLFSTITQTGVVQNVQIKVEGNFTNRQEFAPVADNLKGGMIINCISHVSGQHSTGYVRKMEGGVMVNCLTMGHNRRGAFVYFQKSNSHQNINGYKSGKFYNCYWAASNSVENIQPAENMIECEPLGDIRLRSDDLIDQLNLKKGEFGATWGRDADGYPSFGKDFGNHIIDGSNNRYPVEFVQRDNQVVEVANGLLELSPHMADSSRFVGTLRLKDVPQSSKITWSCNDRSDNNVIQLDETVRLHVFQDGGAVVRATEHRADGTQQLAAEIRVVSASRNIQELRLALDGTTIEKAVEIQGSSSKILQIQAKFEGADEFEAIPPYLVTITPEKMDLLHTDESTGEFWFEQPGTSKLTVTEKTNEQDPVSVTVEITSRYVPVQSVRPAIGGTVELHYRNSMGTGEFIWIPQTAFIEPSNASNKENLTIQSSDPTVAVYGSKAYTPYKNGTVNFVAKINDNGRVLQGESKVEFVYKNPLTQVVCSEKGITLKQGEKQILPLTFKGQPGSQHEVTEPDLQWTFDRNGIVAIQRPDPLMQIRNTGGPDDGNWVASTKFEVQGLRAGTVTAIGTPVDTTGGAKPVKITITVTGDGSSVPEFDIPAFIEKGKQSASNYLKEHTTFAFGQEWAIYTLLRDGHNLPKDELERYYNDVLTNIHTWNSNVLATDAERTAIALNVLNKDITNIDGVNLAELIYNHPDLTKQGSNGLVWALIALDMNQTQIPVDAKWSRQRMVEELLDYQNMDGGFGLDKTGRSGIDMTAMCLQALAPYRNQDKVQAAVDEGVEYLKKAAEKNLNLGSAESISQVILALAVLDKNIVSEAGFGDEVQNLLSALSEYMVEGKGFRHDKNGSVDKMASTQALQALCAYQRFLNGQSSYWDLKGTGSVAGAAQKVIDQIAALPENITLSDALTVQSIRQAYDVLSESQKKQVSNYPKLQAAEQKLNQLAQASQVEQIIASLPDPVTLMDEAAVQAARAAYELLEENEKQQVNNLDRLLRAEQRIVDLQCAAKVEKLIQALPNPVGLAEKAAVQQARSAYEALNAAQKALVKNLDHLLRAEQDVKDLEQAQKVMQLIQALPKELAVKHESMLQAARKAYQQLTEKQQKMVLNLYLLERAEQTMKELKAVEAVENAIDALPDSITADSADAVKQARAAYNQLSPELRSKVKNLDKLVRAEKELKAQKRTFAKYTDILETQSNVIEAQVKDGVVDATQVQEIQGKELILRVKGIMDSGETYAMAIYGEDVAEVKSFKTGISRSACYEEDIRKLAQECEIFSFAQTGAFPGPMMVQMESSLEDGAYLLLRYDALQQRAALVSRVQVENGKVQFIVQQGGEYFLAKKASKKSIPELQNPENVSAEPMQEKQEPAKESTGAVQQTLAKQPEQSQQTYGWIFVPLMLLLVGGIGLTVKKRKEKKGE